MPVPLKRSHLAEVHPFLAAAFRVYTKSAIMERIEVFQHSTKAPLILKDPYRYLSVYQIEILAGAVGMTFYDVLEVIRGKDLKGQVIENWFAKGA